jgi:hypothetical protein
MPSVQAAVVLPADPARLAAEELLPPWRGRNERGEEEEMGARAAAVLASRSCCRSQYPDHTTRLASA